MIVAAFAVVLLAGIAIGITGIGGVLVVPALTGPGGIELGRAVAATSTAFLFPGLQAWWQTAGRRSPSGRRSAGAGPTSGAVPTSGAGPASGAGAVLVAAFAGAIAGAWATGVVDAGVLRLAIGVVAIVSGIHAWIDAARAGTAPPGGGRPAAGPVLGFAVGAGSGLTGTGGPVLLLPALMLMRAPLPGAIVSARRIQLPIALAAALVHLAAGRLDPVLVLLLGCVLLAGGAIGHHVANRLPVPRLKRTMAVLLVLTGLWFMLPVFDPFTAPAAPGAQR